MILIDIDHEHSIFDGSSSVFGAGGAGAPGGLIRDKRWLLDAGEK